MIGRTPLPQLERTVTAAAEAATVLQRIPRATIVEMLHSVATVLERERAALIEMAHLETRIDESRLGAELTRATAQLRLFGSVVAKGDHLQASIDEATPTSPDIRRTMRGVGPVAVYAASNFPFAFGVAGGDTASALAAGNPVIVKAHPGHPRLSTMTAELVVDALESSGAPRGTFGLVAGFESGRDLVTHPSIQAAAFTGSTRGGRALFDLAAARPVPIPFYGELGSINPVVITAAALTARGADIADACVASFTLGQGQLCTKPGLILYPEGGTFLDDIARRTTAVRRGPMLNETASDAFDASIQSLAAKSSVRVIVDGLTGSPWLLATTAADVIADGANLQEECFGPSTLLVSYRDDDELMAAVRSLAGSLASSVIAEASDRPLVVDLLDALERISGRVVWNGWPTGVAVNWSTQHGGPYPSSTPPAATSVGTSAIDRFLRPVAFQDLPDALLPEALQRGNPMGLTRRVNGQIVLPIRSRVDGHTDEADAAPTGRP